MWGLATRTVEAECVHGEGEVLQQLLTVRVLQSAHVFPLVVADLAAVRRQLTILCVLLRRPTCPHDHRC